jgi:uncharacterized membrane protein YhaH (DUF805 family)
MEFAYILSSTQGRIRRGEWWAGLAALAVFGIVAGALILLILGGALAGRIGLLILLILLLYPFFAACAKRFQDRNKPGNLAFVGALLGLVAMILWVAGLAAPLAPGRAVDWILAVFLAAVLAWYVVELGCLRGTVGPNAYGADLLQGQV